MPDDGEVADLGQRCSSNRDDRGSMVLALAVALVLTGTMAQAVAELGVAAAHRRRAQSAADAAALAAVAGGRAAAVNLAARNGAALVALDLRVAPGGGRVATVEVVVGEARARARAIDEP